MDINRHKSHGKYRLSGFKPGAITVNDTTYDKTVVLTQDRLIETWEPQNVSSITREHLAQLITFKPDIILIGTGQKHEFLAEALLVDCFAADIPVEMMSTEKACWLYPVLIEEQRHVVAILMP